MGKLDGKVAIITGGASGMGRIAGQLFAREGAKVVLADINAEAGKLAAEEIAAAGGEARFVEADLTSESDIEALVAATVDSYGRIDVLFSNAGVKNPLGPAHTISEKDWDWVVDTNVRGTFFCVKHVAPHMVEQRSGSIVINASVAGFFALPNQPAYNASKAAEVHFGRSVAAEYGRYNIRCNVICPGPIGGDFATKYIYRDEEEAQRGKRGVGELVPLGRLGSSDEVANVALFLASEDSSYVTGASIPVDGGLTLGLDVINLATRFGRQSQ
ncbi:SDR family NAD(P)-dependent oxidoreductase [Nocardia gamkensis]|uniref:SDR family NAD(P)-dependent oxidoreductase n=1 Tax=Nocardia gamkensis TaxID=352869 RepID=UPI0033FCF0DB